jgi:superfamily II DNA or RNA helicase
MDILPQFANLSFNNPEQSNAPIIPPLALRSYQEPCVNSILALWERNLPAIISAQTGSGKTYIAGMASYLYGAEYVFVIGPKSSLTKWREVLARLFPVDNIACYSYEGWRACGTRMTPNQNQPYTYKLAHERDGKTSYDFEASELWNTLVWDSKTIFILDEFHKAQKRSQRTFAIAANTRNILLYRCSSRVLALSYTPCDNLIDIPTHMYLFGMTQDSFLARYNKHTRRYDTSGLERVLMLARSFGDVDNKDQQKVSLAKYLTGKTVPYKVNKLAGSLFLKYIRKHLVFSCDPDFVRDSSLTPTYNNYFCKVSDRADNVISTIVNDGGVEEESPYIEFEHTIEDSSDMAVLTKIQRNLEKVKRSLYIDLAREWFALHPNGKVVIMVLFLETMDAICEELSEYHPVRIEGCMSTAMRDASIAMFQAHNLDSQVIVATITTGGEAIDLHDTSPNGSFRRRCLMPPTFYTKSMVQSSGRVFRDSVTSQAQIDIVYTIGEHARESSEKRFIDSVRRKTTNIKQYHADNQQSVLPCDYENVVSDRIYRTIVDE